MIRYLVMFLLLRSANTNIDQDFTRIDSVLQELPCGAVGGRCTVAVDCPSGHLTELRGLCPTQKYEGVECCYGISKKEKRCLKMQGFCVRSIDFCASTRVVYGTPDCKNVNKICCLR